MQMDYAIQMANRSDGAIVASRHRSIALWHEIRTVLYRNRTPLGDFGLGLSRFAVSRAKIILSLDEKTTARIQIRTVLYQFRRGPNEIEFPQNEISGQERAV